MIKVKFNDMNKIFQVSFTKVSDHVVSMVGPFLPADTSGFKTYRMNGRLLGDWSGFTTIYRVIKDGVQFSDDGSTWVEPEPEPIDPKPTWQDKTLELEIGIAELYETALEMEAGLQQKDLDLEEAIADIYEELIDMSAGEPADG